MKKFFTQPIGEFSRQNSMVFLVCNIVLIAINFGSFEVDALGWLLNFVWGFSLFGIVISGYYLAEDHVPDFWKAGSTVLASVIVVGTFIEIAMPEYQENGFGPMYFKMALGAPKGGCKRIQTDSDGLHWIPSDSVGFRRML